MEGADAIFSRSVNAELCLDYGRRAIAELVFQTRLRKKKFYALFRARCRLMKVDISLLKSQPTRWNGGSYLLCVSGTRT